MSSIVDKITDGVKTPQGVIGISVGLIVMLYMFFVNDNNPVFSFIMGLVAAVLSVMIFSDFEKRSESKKADSMNEEAIIRKRKEQQETELTEAKCISCNQPMKTNDKKCSNCGFARHDYSAKTVTTE